VYEVDPLACPECGGVMKVAAFIEPSQADVIDKILRHCGLWCVSSPRAPPADGDPVDDPDGDWGSRPAAHESGELPFVDETTFSHDLSIFATPRWLRGRHSPAMALTRCVPNLPRLRSGSWSGITFPTPFLGRRHTVVQIL
jgi:hypothetical protein